MTLRKLLLLSTLFLFSLIFLGAILFDAPNFNSWSNGDGLLLWYLAVLIITFAIELVALRYLLNYFDTIKNQAYDVIDHKFTLQVKLPKIKEMRNLMEVMNRLSQKIKNSFIEQTNVIHKLNEQINSDSLTGLANRQYFNTQLDALLNKSHMNFEGALFLIELKNLDEYKKIKGYQRTEEFLISVARCLKEFTSVYNNLLFARLSKHSFSLLIPNINLPQAEEVAATLSKQLACLLPNDNIIHFILGGTLYKTNQLRSEFLFTADEALHVAQAKGKNSFHVRREDEGEHLYIHSFKQFKTLLDRNIIENSYCLFFQPVFQIEADERRILSIEGLFRLKNPDGAYINAGEFYDLIDRENMKVVLDKLAIQYIISLPKISSLNIPLSVNLSSNSILDADFITWLENMARSRQLKTPLAFEIAEDTAVKNTEAVNQFIQKFRDFGFEFILDDFGNTMRSLKYIESLPVHYVKIHGGLTMHIDTSIEEKTYARMLVELAKNLNIKVVAKGIETIQQQHELLQFGIDGFQGYLYAKPEPLEKVIRLHSRG